MPSLERPEISGNEDRYPGPGDFVKLLKWHLNRGTRPKGTHDKVGKKWDNKEFAEEVGLTDKTIRNWVSGRVHSQDSISIERVLFGENPEYDDWRIDLRAAHGRRAEEQALRPPHFPRSTRNFLGRDEDVAKILDVLLSGAPSHAILVQGGPGIGKTSLTQVIAWHENVIKRFGDDRRWFVPLETAGTAEAMQSAITRALGADPNRGFRATLAYLAQNPGLLVLDNLETPWDPISERSATEQILADLADIPELGLLASFRGRDRVSGPAWALVHPVEQLRAPFDQELFCRVAGYDFLNDPHFNDFLSALSGIPLAIELVATRAHGRGSLATLWTQWKRIGSHVATSRDLESGRLTSLPHSIELSLASERLNETAHRLFRLLGQLPAGLKEEDRDALLGIDGFDAEEALTGVGLAVEIGDRLDLLSPIRDHAARHHGPTQPDSNTWPLHFLYLTKELGEIIGNINDKGSFARLAPEFPNIEEAIHSALKADRRSDVMAALTGLGNGRSPYTYLRRTGNCLSYQRRCPRRGQLHQRPRRHRA